MSNEGKAGEPMVGKRANLGRKSPLGYAIVGGFVLSAKVDFAGGRELRLPAGNRAIYSTTRITFLLG
jgi:hypothetical protein